MNDTTLILKAGQKLATLADHPGDFEHWIAAGLGTGAGPVQVLDVRDMPTLPRPSDIGRVVVTGSAAMVTEREAWAEATARWLCTAVTAGTPVLGICFGHQLLAHALGGRVDDNPRGVEVGSVELSLLPAAGEDALLGDLPARLTVNMSHRQSVVELPDGAQCLAHTARDACAAFRHGTHAWGLQFHPEFDARVTGAHVAWYRPALAHTGADAEELASRVQDTPLSFGLMARFARITRAAMDSGTDSSPATSG